MKVANFVGYVAGKMTIIATKNTWRWWRITEVRIYQYLGGELGNTVLVLRSRIKAVAALGEASIVFGKDRRDVGGRRGRGVPFRRRLSRKSELDKQALGDMKSVA